MPWRRCKYYDDDGKPISGGCRGQNDGGCDFVHPSHVRWDSTPRGHVPPLNRDGYARDGPRADRFGLSTAMPPSPPVPSPDSTNNRWYSHNKGKGVATPAGGEGSGWGKGGDSGWRGLGKSGGGAGLGRESSSESGKGGDSGWGAGTDSGWGTSTDSGWGTSTDSGRGEGTGSGWGSGEDSGWGDPESGASSGGGSSSTSKASVPLIKPRSTTESLHTGWGDGDSGGWGTASHDEPFESTGWADPNGGWGGAPAVEIPKTQATARRNSSLESEPPIPPSTSHALPARRDSLTTDTKLGPTILGQRNADRKRRASSPDVYEPPETARVSASPAPLVTPSPPTDFTTPTWTLAFKPIRATSAMTDDTTTGGYVTPPSNPQDTFKAVIRAMSTVVQTHLDWKAAQADMDRWKRAQHTPDYAHASASMRIKFDAIRAEYTQIVTEAQKRYKHALSTLSDLPDLIDAAESPAVIEIMDVAMIASYTDELQMWLSDFKTIQAEIHATKTPPSPSPPPFSPTPTLSPLGISILEWIQALPPNQWTWDIVRRAQNQLEESLDQVNEVLSSTHLMDYENIDIQVNHFFDEKILEAKAKSIEASQVVTADLKQQLGDLVPKIEIYGDDLEGQTSPAVKLLEKVTRNEQLLTKLQAEVQENTKFLAEMSQLVEDFEQKEDQKGKKISDLAHQLSKLYKLPQSNAPRPPQSLHDMLPIMHNFVHEQLEKEFVPILEKIHLICLNSNDDILHKLTHQAKSISQAMEILRNRLQVS